MAGSERDSETVSFRLGGAQLARLSGNAESLRVSRGEYARQLVVAALQDEARLQQLEELRALRGELSLLRTDVATTLESVLANLTDVDESDVKAYVSKHLRRL